MEQLHAMVISIVYAELTVWFIAIGIDYSIIFYTVVIKHMCLL